MNLFFWCMIRTELEIASDWCRLPCDSHSAALPWWADASLWGTGNSLTAWNWQCNWKNTLLCIQCYTLYTSKCVRRWRSKWITVVADRKIALQRLVEGGLLFISQCGSLICFNWFVGITSCPALAEVFPEHQRNKNTFKVFWNSLCSVVFGHFTIHYTGSQMQVCRLPFTNKSLGFCTLRSR